MAIRITAGSPGFAADLERLIEARRAEESDLREEVAAIVARVAKEGDAALLDYTARFDGERLGADQLRVGEAEIERAIGACPKQLRDALGLAARRIEAFHRHQLPQDLDLRDELGVTQGLRWRAIDAVGLYVPGGTAAYPSSVLMNAVPAKVAGVPRLVVTVPAPGGRLAPPVLLAAHLAGVDEIYRVGGAQAVAALAFGTATIAAVDKIVGPGNAWVAEAKRQVFGRVGIDMIAGPSEVVVVAAGDQDPAWIAADLLSQAEHDARAQAILITDDGALAEAVDAAAREQLAALPRSEIAGASWRDHGAIVVLDDLDQAPAVVDRLAPEHLQLLVPEPAKMAARIRHAGAMFLGPFTPEVIGDYVGGPNHVLPTGRTARFASGLGIHDFLKRSTILGCDATSLAALGPAAACLARAEGLEAHARAIERRLAEPGR